MKKKFIITIVLMLSLFFIAPAKTEALTNNIDYSSIVYIGDNDTKVSDLYDNYNQDQECDGTDNSILGNVNDENSVAWLLQMILNFIKILGPILVVLLSGVDFLIVIFKSDDEAMGKAQKKLAKRLVLAGLLFFIPLLVQVILGVFGITSNSTCGLS